MAAISIRADRVPPRPDADWPALYGALESRHRDEIEALLRIGLAMAAAPELPDLLRAVYQGLCPALDLGWFVVAHVDEAAGHLVFPLALETGLNRSLAPADLYRDNSLTAYAVRMRRAISSVNGESWSVSAWLAPTIALPAAHAVIPLMNQGRALGALAVGSRQVNAFGEAELQLLSLVASMLSMAVEKAHLYDAVARHARSLEERVIARTAELESEKIRFESIMHGLSEGLILFDLQHTLAFANERAQILLGLPPETMIGLGAWELWRRVELLPEMADQVSRDFVQALERVDDYPTVVVSRPMWAPPPEGGKRRPTAARDLSLRLFPVRDHESRLLGRGLILQDITREREMDRMKDELVNVVSHELRTPLSSVLGFAELLLTRDFPEAKRRLLIETIHKEAERLSALINDFLDLRRLESGRQVMAFKEVRLADVVQSAAASFALAQPTHRLSLDLPPNLPPVRADPDRLAEALRNLLANAFKYSPNGGQVNVRVRLHGGDAHVTVADEGLGLPADVIPHLFRRFYRVDSSDRREIGGTGLGLAIVRKIIRAHGGQVWAESAGPGQGSTFGFSLPLAAQAAQARQLPTTTRPLSPEVAAEFLARRAQALPEAYCLLVEDDPGAAALACEHLAAAGLEVVQAIDTEEALAFVRRRKPMGVVLDVRPTEPELAWAFLEAVRLKYPPEQLPIVVTTVLDERSHALALGATECLTKPFDSRRLVALLAGTGHEVLVVDSDAMLQELTRSILERSGYRVRGLANGAAALESLAVQMPDLVMLDLIQPETDGVQVLTGLRTLPGGQRLPVIAVTARPISALGPGLPQPENVWFLAKADYTPVRLRALVEQALREKTPVASAAPEGETIDEF